MATVWQRPVIGSFSNSNENGKKAVGLDYHNNNSTRVSRFFLYISLLLLHDYGPVHRYSDIFEKENFFSVFKKITHPYIAYTNRFRPSTRKR